MSSSVRKREPSIDLTTSNGQDEKNVSHSVVATGKFHTHNVGVTLSKRSDQLYTVPKNSREPTLAQTIKPFSVVSPVSSHLLLDNDDGSGLTTEESSHSTITSSDKDRSSSPTDSVISDLSSQESSNIEGPQKISEPPKDDTLLVTDSSKELLQNYVHLCEHWNTRTSKLENSGYRNIASENLEKLLDHLDGHELPFLEENLQTADKDLYEYNQRNKNNYPPSVNKDLKTTYKERQLFLIKHSSLTWFAKKFFNGD